MEQMQTPFFEGSVPSELSGDYILPDTYPDVKKILRVRARPVLIGRFISGGKLEFNGAVDYIVVFSAENAESPDKPETLHSVHFAAEYAGSAAPEDPSLLGEDCAVKIEPRVASCSARLQNPRKLSLRSTVSTDLKLSCTKPSKPTIEGKDELETLVERLPTLIERSFTADHKQISENLEPDASQPAIDEIITCDAELCFCEAKPQMSQGSLTISLKGEAVVDCIYKAQTEPGDYRSFTRKIPLSYVVNADEYAEFFADAMPGTLCASASGTPTEINASVGENSYGERRVLELDLSFDIDASLFADAETPLTLDAYSTSHPSQCAMKRLELSSLGKLVSSNFSVNESAPRESLGLPGDVDRSWNIVDTQADVSLSSCSFDRGRAQLSGEARISCILSDRSEFAAADFTVPVRCELSVGDMSLSGPAAFSCTCKATDLRARIDPSKIFCDFEVSLNAVFLKRAMRQAVESITVSGEPLPDSNDSSKLILCYPSPGETLWQIAKRYRTTKAKLADANPGLTEDAKVVLIP